MSTTTDVGTATFIESWGSDERIIEAARMSTGKGFLGWEGEDVFDCPFCAYRYVAAPGLDPTKVLCPNDGNRMEHRAELSHKGDTRLLKYLWEHKHTTPFEMAGAVYDISAPIMTFRQWFTHRTQSRNEHSARYGPLPELDYMPTVERCMQDGGTNKQAIGVNGRPAAAEDVRAWLVMLENHYTSAQLVYQVGLATGIPKELARLPLAVGRFSKMRVSANLLNWTKFLALRDDDHAQWEIHQVAAQITANLTTRFPRTMRLFEESRHAK